MPIDSFNFFSVDTVQLSRVILKTTLQATKFFSQGQLPLVIISLFSEFPSPFFMEFTVGFYAIPKSNKNGDTHFLF